MMTKAEAGRLGGLKTVEKYGSDHMRKLAQKGAEAFHKKYMIVPVGTSYYAIVTRAMDSKGNHKVIAHMRWGL